MLVKIAIDLALDRLFTYEVPKALEKKLAIGQLLLVPFGHRQARGFAVELAEPSEATGYKLKSVLAIEDEVPFFSIELLKLARRLAAYTAAPIESVLHAALPAAVLKRNAHAKELLYVESVAGAAPSEGRRREIYDDLVRLGGGYLSSLCKELKVALGTIRAMEKAGQVTIAPRVCRRDPLANRKILASRPLPLNDGQRSAMDAILKSPKPVLLFGITGSGKTEVYLQVIARELEAGRGAIVMVPEISLTPQTVQRFASRFGSKVAVLHSALSDGERYDEWHRIRKGEARVVIGPRSVVFAPVAKLGLIVVDEEHDSSYKQDDNPRYHARDAAVLRGAIEGAKVVLGSATPSLESWRNVQLGKYELTKITERAGSGTLPNVQLVDMREDGGGIYSRVLLEAISTRLSRGEQTMLFLNRRGYSRSYTCASCGEVVTCPNCDIPYTYHRSDSCLRCHICGGWIRLPEKCPACGSREFDCIGVGTQRAEAALVKCFPHARILRMDADSVSRKNSHDDILSMFRRHEADILLGTQMIAKGLDFPNVTLVGVLNADASGMPDFRSSERTYQLLAQVAGRAGRAELPGQVLIQSRDLAAPAIHAVAFASYPQFAESEMREREEGYFPPFCHLAVINLKSKENAVVSAWAQMYSKSIASWGRRVDPSGERFIVSEAMPSMIERADGWYRWQIIVRAPRSSEIVKAWRWIVEARPAPASLRVAIDVDAYCLA